MWAPSYGTGGLAKATKESQSSTALSQQLRQRNESRSVRLLELLSESIRQIECNAYTNSSSHLQAGADDGQCIHATTDNQTIATLSNLMQVLEASCILRVLHSFLFSPTIQFVVQHAELYSAIFNVLGALSSSPHFQPFWSAPVFPSSSSHLCDVVREFVDLSQDLATPTPAATEIATTNDNKRTSTADSTQVEMGGVNVSGSVADTSAVGIREVGAALAASDIAEPQQPTKAASVSPFDTLCSLIRSKLATIAALSAGDVKTISVEGAKKTVGVGVPHRMVFPEPCNVREVPDLDHCPFGKCEVGKVVKVLETHAGKDNFLFAKLSHDFNGKCPAYISMSSTMGVPVLKPEVLCLEEELAHLEDDLAPLPESALAVTIGRVWAQAKPFCDRCETASDQLFIASNEEMQ